MTKPSQPRERDDSNPSREQPAQEHQTSAFNIPNALTTLRIFMVPLFLWLLLSHEGHDPQWRLWALLVFCLAMYTDKLDGDLARKWGIVTNFGKIADPIADKALVAAALIGLWWVGNLPWWVPAVILIRELGITAIRMVIIRYEVMPASRGGKLKTVLQAVAIALFIAWVPVLEYLGRGVAFWLLISAWVVMTAAIVTTLVTGADYCMQAIKITKAHRSDRTK